MRIKICGITKSEQAKAIADLGATALGFICISSSPRYVTPTYIKAIVKDLPPEMDKIDLSSGVERAPGDKDLDKVARLFSQLRLASSTALFR